MIPPTRSAIIIASWRCGGTFLSHCLSNHPDIFCTRGEVLHYRNVWRKTAKPQNILRCIMNQPHYGASLAKITYNQAFKDEVWNYLLDQQPYVIWLYRDNLLRQAVSLIQVKLYHKNLIEKPVHSLQVRKYAKIEIDPCKILDQIEYLAKANRMAKVRIKKFKSAIALTYAEVVGGENKTANVLPSKTTKKVCEFLGVESRWMSCDLKRINPYPLRDMLKNWDKIEAVIKKSDHAHFLKEETTWTS